MDGIILESTGSHKFGRGRPRARPIPRSHIMAARGVPPTRQRRHSRSSTANAPLRARSSRRSRRTLGRSTSSWWTTVRRTAPVRWSSGSAERLRLVDAAQRGRGRGAQPRAAGGARGVRRVPRCRRRVPARTPGGRRRADDRQMPAWARRSAGCVGSIPDGSRDIYGEAYHRSRAFPEHLWPSSFVQTSGATCRRSVLERVGPIDESLRSHDELDLWIRIGEVSRIVEIPRAAGRLPRHAGQLLEALGRRAVGGGLLPGDREGAEPVPRALRGRTAT